MPLGRGLTIGSGRGGDLAQAPTHTSRVADVGYVFFCFFLLLPLLILNVGLLFPHSS